MRLYNYLARKVEEFVPIDPPNVGLYTCGPTVYDFTHIGHARTYVFADILKRTLEFNGYKVKHVVNITDVGHLTSDSDTGEDKMEAGAAREKKSVWEVAQFYTDDFFKMLEELNIEKPDIFCKATDHIDEMIKLIESLQEKGFTYKITDGIYFDSSKFPDYGRLTGNTFTKLQEGLKAGARVEVVVGKKHPTDFALWKFSPSGAKRQMEWDSPWGKGFPGWHIECSAMSMKYLGNHFDIHTGGVDHVPIHHTNEIAQSEAATGKKFVNFWVEGEHLAVDGEKMSKSLGNFIRVADIAGKGYDPLALRYLFLTAHYRSKLNFTWDSLKASQNALDNLQKTVVDWDEPYIGCAQYEQDFFAALGDDLDTPEALAVLWKMTKDDTQPTASRHKTLLLMDEVLGLGLGEVKKVGLTGEQKELLNKREKLRSEGKWDEADEMRKLLEEEGILVEDTPQGPKTRRKT